MPSMTASVTIAPMTPATALPTPPDELLPLPVDVEPEEVVLGDAQTPVPFPHA